MMLKQNNKKTLSYLRQQISEQIKIAKDNGLFNISYRNYSKSQNDVKNNIFKKFDEFEQNLLECINSKEKGYLFLFDLKVRTTNISSHIDYFELILNTDANLIYNKKISTIEKINQARNILSKKVSDSKKVLLDIYYLYRILKIYGYKIGWSNSKKIDEMINIVIDKYFSANNSYATSNEYYILKQISESKKISNAFDLYYENFDKLLDVTFIKVNNNQKEEFVPVNLYDQLESIPNFSKNLYSPFYGGMVNFMSGMAAIRDYNFIFTERNISLDSNAVPFIRTLEMENKINCQKK